MRRHVRSFTARHEPASPLALHVKSGLGAGAGLGLVGALAAWSGWPLLLAPLGATVVLLFGQPGSALAQPANVFGGYLVGTVTGVAAQLALPGSSGAAAAAVGLALAVMLALRVTHPPAGAVPLVALAAPGECAQLFGTLLLATLGLVAAAVLHHRLPPRTPYPRPAPD